MKPNRRVKLSDLASKLGLSTSTVSRALNDHPKIPTATKKRVQLLADELSYHPNPFAKGLLKQKTKTIGVLLPSFKLPFFVDITDNIQKELKSYGYNLIVTTTGKSLKDEKEAFWKMAKAHVDGIIAIINQDHEEVSFLNDILDEGIPIIFIDRVVESIDANYVLSDDFTGSYTAIDHLIKTGHKKILYLEGPENLSTSFYRTQGYLEALKDNQINDTNVLSCENVDEVKLKLQSCPSSYDAIACFNDYYAFEALEYLQAQKVQVPNQVSIIGFADEPLCKYTSPKLSTVAQPCEEIGKISVSNLLNEINSLQINQPTEFKTIKIPTTLKIRESCK
ncbi:LacI family DNA-binding transcriptional regulator [Flammeovirga pacifica]|uniref:HTH lacI-type domain-containing protein n=1 Tax=Flammeovirga pacifica TaxID=915059 RepID=A0A1S1YSZ3_FLAPC|nr:LacI family DNA-binding transcriptional regulator [Flammeovirga pacifica]OHX64151.1 hypothetical protein NH26_21335 [Flammeovirga pacifica]